MELDRLAEHSLGARAIAVRMDDEFLTYMMNMVLLDIGRKIAGEMRKNAKPGESVEALLKRRPHLRRVLSKKG